MQASRANVRMMKALEELAANYADLLIEVKALKAEIVEMRRQQKPAARTKAAAKK